MNKSWWIGLVLALAACSTQSPQKTPGPLVEQIAHLGSPVDQAQLWEALGPAQVIFLGENHDNLRHHKIQVELLEHLVGQGKKPALGMELFSKEQTSLLMAFVQSNPKDPAQAEQRLRKALGWEGREEWPGYLEVLRYARQERLEVFGLDLEAGLIRRLTGLEVQELSLVEQSLLPPVSNPGEAYQALMFEKFTQGHCGWSEPKHLAGLYRVWLARNEAMALTLTQAYRPDRPLVALMGSGHLEFGQAVPWAFKRRLPAVPTFGLALMEVGLDRPALAAYFEPQTSLGRDFGPSFPWIWLTDRHSWVDPCLRFKSQLAAHPQKSP
ncbi:MAG: hypothetical protein A2600_03115 [Candidatus Lambdaproteobacteria bacterium RIFOXYD1_FULL_56_27]|uniref:Haem-binding uptake Tiki superfamily ChaN domain-containing protein n=1 Tax=Candidatus Lambdaproteobacteria bacterium RIFOXYD2_FULL_56_26 TaxID=1817773 RepID=A0A1F6H339_9PROT|nr:MAG: hypothetical protein A2557_07180 [Candidatus Lambdaproteobacteria bacterium RIFOXYD2_FULL_56_26]OGH05383.1 MAG: hypothetical protein A2426_05505 [Candidatus Lambdaproteobacteria bacterium RIFOXYC1_FULL_56_13]OGH09227.1 MAG: hypothetical protein A2600_03115 [Candidatus Lambdaproteobacteria bacterium RIFOXYD1_FULL_56_27]